MTWTFSITGRMLTDGTRRIKSYSGNYGEEQDNPSCTHDIGRGPLPIGLYDIGHAIDDTHLGPLAIRLTPQASTNEFGRAGFFIHGDSISHPGHASDGCICTNGPDGRADRTYINASSDKVLEVVI